MARTFPRTRLALAGLSLLVAGCGGDTGPERFPVSGTVTFKGAPVPMGTVFFDPQEGAGVQGFANIRDGKYDTALEGAGVVGGPHLVRVQGFDGKVGNEAPYGQPLFLEYETKKDFPKEPSQYDIAVPAQR